MNILYLKCLFTWQSKSISVVTVESLSNTDSEVIVLKAFNLIQFYLEMKGVLKAHPVV